jgi:hypothetical protein
VRSACRYAPLRSSNVRRWQASHADHHAIFAVLEEEPSHRRTTSRHRPNGQARGGRSALSRLEPQRGCTVANELNGTPAAVLLDAPRATRPDTRTVASEKSTQNRCPTSREPWRGAGCPKKKAESLRPGCYARPGRGNAGPQGSGQTRYMLGGLLESRSGRPRIVTSPSSRLHRQSLVTIFSGTGGGGPTGGVAPRGRGRAAVAITIGSKVFSHRAAGHKIAAVHARPSHPGRFAQLWSEPGRPQPRPAGQQKSDRRSSRLSGPAVSLQQPVSPKAKQTTEIEPAGRQPMMRRAFSN